MARRKKIKKHHQEFSIVIPDSIWNVSEKEKEESPKKRSRKKREAKEKAVEPKSGRQPKAKAKANIEEKKARKSKKPSPKKASSLSAQIKVLPWLQEEIEKRIQSAKKRKGFKIEFLLKFENDDSAYRVSILKTLDLFSKGGYDVWPQISIYDKETLQYRVSIEWNERL